MKLVSSGDIKAKQLHAPKSISYLKNNRNNFKNIQMIKLESQCF